jgi:hypothetical protein
MKAQTLTAERLRELVNYDPDSGLFFRLKKPFRGFGSIGDQLGILTKFGYLVFRVDGTQHRAHRLAFLYMTGAWPDSVIDHMDGDRTNNKWSNLRSVSESVNQQNRRAAQKGNSSGVLGASYSSRKRKWRSSIRVNGKWVGLGYYSTPEDAGNAYLVAKRKFHEGCMI